MKLFYIFLCLFIVVISPAQLLRYNVAQPSISLSAYNTSQKNPLSFTQNQAALASVNKISIGCFAEKRFLLAATNYYKIAIAMPTKIGPIGLQFNYGGFTNFSENKIGLAYAKSLGKKMDVGIQFNYYGYRIPGYGAATSINAEAGAIFHFTTKLHAGLHIYNPTSSKLGKSADYEKLASAYKLGLGYEASDNFFIAAEMLKEENIPINFIVGIQYQFGQQFFFKTGFESINNTLFASVGAGWTNMRVDLSASFHPQLGLSPGLMIISSF